MSRPTGHTMSLAEIVSSLKWYYPHWLDGTITTAYLNAGWHAQGIEARQRHDREAGHGPEDESPVANGDAPND